jgi:hypothetical protein
VERFPSLRHGSPPAAGTPFAAVPHAAGRPRVWSELMEGRTPSMEVSCEDVEKERRAG